ncbi:OLC1v1002405C1 [Oldenlandia corymbosa var. corymbosa]|uniref:OLC1v1002405C1 n=1 Tax=Oldenlandia corymbosa var. corymbosa TaxID=529605 RepID=A0AAV1D7J5_OLDCO|nr:OLC1v1002405C1 [Oldenlandia corymbosa var. corymbosa]
MKEAGRTEAAELGKKSAPPTKQKARQKRPPQSLCMKKGYDVGSAAPDNSYKVSILPYEFKDDDGTTKPNIRNMASECIKLYNETHVPHCGSCGGSQRVLPLQLLILCTLYKITFKASPVDGSSKAKIFLGKYLVDIGVREGDEDESGEMFCKTKDEAFDKDLPCFLPCCKRYDLYACNSRTYLEYTHESFKQRKQASSWNHGAPSWVLQELAKNDSQVSLLGP